MKNTKIHSNNLLGLFRKRKITTMQGLKKALGTDVERTVFRKLGELDYRTSYSHHGRYYTLDEIARFDKMGLWSYKDVWFSKSGSLLATIESIVEMSEAGYFVDELERLLYISAKDAVRILVCKSRISRQKRAGRYLYCSTIPARRKQQILFRQAIEDELKLGAPLPQTDIMPEELKASIILFSSLLDEKQRRLYAGIESLKIGHGGNQRIAELLGLDSHTVSKGRKELLDRDVEIDRVRKKGAGRRSLEKKRRKFSPKSKS